MHVEIETSWTSSARKLRLGASVLVLGLAAHVPAQAATPSAQVSSTVASALQRTFVANRGQFVDGVRLAARGPGYGLAFEVGAARISLGESAPGVRMSLAAGQAVEPHGVDPLPFRLNFLLGAQRDWRSEVEAFESVAYSTILPGIDWIFHAGAAGQLEHDFVVAPRAAPDSIRLIFEGAETHVTVGGKLRLTLPDGSVLEQAAPVAYQRDARGQKQLVAARFDQRKDGSIGFALGGYDRARELVIDPTLLYSTYFGGSGFEDTHAVGMDASGNVYLAGSTGLGLFPIRNALQSTYGGGSTDAFVCKLNASGTAIVYATFLGGSDADAAMGMAVDAGGAVYLAGNTLSTDFPLLSAQQGTLAGSVDGFFAKLNNTGTGLVYSSYWGGAGDDFPNAIAVDALGVVRIAGTTFSSDFPTIAPFQAAWGGQGDAFLSVVNAAGSATFSSYLGGAGNDAGTGVALGASGNAYVVGATSGSFPSVGSFQGTFGGGGFDAFVATVSSAGALSKSSYLGGTGRDEAAAVAVAPSGSVVVTGYSMSADFPGVASGFQPSRGGGADAFVSEVSALGNELTFSSYLGGTGNDLAQAVSVDSVGVISVAGFTDSVNFPLLDSTQAALGGGTDAFLTQVSAHQISFSSVSGGSSTDKAVGVANDAATKTFAVVGNTTSTNFPTLGALYAARIGSQDAFVQRFSTQTPKPTPWGGWQATALLAALLTASVFIQSRKGHTKHTTVI